MKYVLILMLCCLANTVHAQAKWHTSEIAKIYPHADGSFVLTFKTNSPDCTNSVPNKYHYVRAGNNGVNAEGVKGMLSVALTAATLGKPVSVNFDAASSACYINRLHIGF
ncbi:hypothetical protein [Alteromonas sp. ASW11-130]|uniref:hypothetical protein n=1 Tax=Alteromonas sp. ASW11-130 TaxID=3015775 RepID=UPI002241B156|nr:hypothetical protein [Alteromonas sp. ASW11-130]MCW8091130.1 hypothetical protein [Alteromonas sp. ASW11-130]